MKAKKELIDLMNGNNGYGWLLDVIVGLVAVFSVVWLVFMLA